MLVRQGWNMDIMSWNRSGKSRIKNKNNHRNVGEIKAIQIEHTKYHNTQGWNTQAKGNGNSRLTEKDRK